MLAGIDRSEGAVISALVPNLRGAERAASAGVDAAWIQTKPKRFWHVFALCLPYLPEV